MLKNAYDVSPSSVSRESILKAIARLLQRLSGDDPLVPLGDMASADAGEPDLAFVKRDTGDIATVMVHLQGDFAGFALQAAAYHRWLKECVRLCEKILGRAIGVEMYIISKDVPSADSYLLKVLSDISGLFFIQYQVMAIEEQETPVIRFHLLEMKSTSEDRLSQNEGRESKPATAPGCGQPSPVYTLSSREIEEFNLLKKRYLA